MIQRLGPESVSPWQLPSTGGREPAPLPVDRVELGREESHPFPTRLASAFLIGAAVFATAGTAAAAPEPALTNNLTLEIEKRARAYGISESTIEQLDPVTAETVRTIPDDVARMYGSFSDAQKRVVYEQLSGTTRVLMVKVDNRKAFIDGEALGVDAFPIMRDRIDEQVDRQVITRREGDALKRAIDRMRTLKPEQRAAIARIIELELKPAPRTAPGA